VPSAYAVHPEFGYLCPSARLRRRMRACLVLFVLALIAGARTVMLTSDSHDPGVGAVAAARPSDQASLPASISMAAASSSSCAESATQSREGKCLSSMPKMKVVHTATDAPTIARIPLGRSVSPQASVVAQEQLVTSALDPEPASASISEPTPTAPVDATAAAPTEQPSQSTAAPKPQKRARSQGRQREQDWRGGWSWREARSERWSGYDRGYAGNSWNGHYGSWGSFW
jgi:hypothetical protein